MLRLPYGFHVSDVAEVSGSNLSQAFRRPDRRQAGLGNGIAIARECHHNPDTDGPHVVTSPIAVPEAHPGDLLAITPTTLAPRFPTV